MDWLWESDREATGVVDLRLAESADRVKEEIKLDLMPVA